MWACLNVTYSAAFVRHQKSKGVCGWFVVVDYLLNMWPLLFGGLIGERTIAVGTTRRLVNIDRLLCAR